jgi:hypothetical protein
LVEGVRVETGIAASYGGSLARRSLPVAPVARVDAPAPVRAPVAYTPERVEAARQMAAAIAVSTGIDATGLSLRARHAVHAYSTVRDGDRREYLHRVFGLEDRA